MKTTITYEEAVAALGRELEPALDQLWDSNGWDEEVDFGLFLREWTERVEGAVMFRCKYIDDSER